MGRYTGPACRLCRREGVKLFLKGDRCNGGKCGFEKRNRPPGMHNWRRGKSSEFGQRLREKQKVKRYYGVYEQQFMKYYELASSMPGNTGETLLILLERRLDNVLTRGGFAYSRRQARQFISHGHITINGKKVDLPSYLVSQGDIVKVSEKPGSQKIIKAIVDKHSVTLPSWLEKAADKLELKVVQLPVRSEITIEIIENRIVEFCSR